MKRMLLLAIGSALSLSAFAQTTSQTTTVVKTSTSTSTFRVIETSRTVQAINYRHRSGAADVDLVGTALLPSACLLYTSRCV